MNFLYFIFNIVICIIFYFFICNNIKKFLTEHNPIYDCDIYLLTKKDAIDGKFIQLNKNFKMDYLPRKDEIIMYNGRKYQIIDIMHHYNINFKSYIDLFVEELI